jgi:signal peptidase I
VTSKKAWTTSVSAGVLLVVLVFVGLFGGGYRFFVVQTPSMATTAPVGTLVGVRPEASYAIGDIISFERTDRSYTHRIVAQTAQGWVTKGDLNGAPDPLPVTNSQIIGKVVFIGKYLGFLVDALPWILIGCAAVYAITLLPRVRPSWRWQIRLVGWSLVTSIVVLWQHPWVNMVMLGYVPDDTAGVDMHLVNTGIFPVKVLGTILRSGQDAVVNQTMADAGGRYSVTPQLALNLGWFLGLLFLCLAPVIASLLIPVEDPIPVAATEVADVPEPKPITPRPRWQVRVNAFAPALVVVAAVIAVSLVLQAGTQSAYVASIRNSTSTAGTRSYFTCRNAVTSLGASGTYLAWALGTTGTSETDLSGNTRTGAYMASATTSSTSVGCNQDTPKAAVTFNGTSQCLYENNNYVTSGYMPNTFSLEAWFNTSLKSGGVIIGFGASRNSVTESNWDRHIYLDKDGRVVFGVYPGAVKIVYTKAGLSYADGKWHHVIATLSSAGESLYVDGTLAMTDTTVTSAEQVSGYWKVGCGNLDNWRNAATDAAGSTALDYTGPKYFTGQIQYAAVYNSALNATQVLQHYQAGAA